MDENINVDRAAIRVMVEDFWRSFLSVANTNPEIGKESIARFDERIQATASLMAPEQAHAFLQAIDQERGMLFDEYNRNPSALKQRLGLVPQVEESSYIEHHQQSLGDVVAKTAVRATIWQSIAALFRIFR